MRFTRNYLKDLRTLKKAFGKERFAFARFGDGERTIMTGGIYHCSDGWVYGGKAPGRYKALLTESLGYSHPDYYIGIEGRQSLPRMCWYMAHMNTPVERITDACLFVNSRWKESRKWMQGIRRQCALVGSGKRVDFRIPHNCLQPEYDYAPLLAKLLEVQKPILLAGGPLANILVMEYLKAGGRQTIIDIGTVLDLEMFGKPTRCYQRSKKKGKKKGKKKIPRKFGRLLKKRRPVPRRKK